jgi:hypothetical protein
MNFLIEKLLIQLLVVTQWFYMINLTDDFSQK